MFLSCCFVSWLLTAVICVLHFIYRLIYRLNLARYGKTAEGLAALNFMDDVNQRQRGLFGLFDSTEGLNVNRNTAQHNLKRMGFCWSI